MEYKLNDEDIVGCLFDSAEINDLPPDNNSLVVLKKKYLLLGSLRKKN